MLRSHRSDCASKPFEQGHKEGGARQTVTMLHLFQQGTRVRHAETSNNRLWSAFLVPNCQTAVTTCWACGAPHGATALQKVHDSLEHPSTFVGRMYLSEANQTTSAAPRILVKGDHCIYRRIVQCCMSYLISIRCIMARLIVQQHQGHSGFCCNWLQSWRLQLLLVRTYVHIHCAFLLQADVISTLTSIKFSPSPRYTSSLNCRLNCKCNSLLHPRYQA